MGRSPLWESSGTHGTIYAEVTFRKTMKQDLILTTKRSRIEGFSMIDLLLAFAIIFFLLVNLAQILILAQNSQNRYRDHLLASGFVLEQLAVLRSCPFQHTDMQPGSYLKEYQDPDSERVFVVNWTIADVSPDLKSVEICCSRKEGSKHATKTSLYLSQELGF